MLNKFVVKELNTYLLRSNKKVNGINVTGCTGVPVSGEFRNMSKQNLLINGAAFPWDSITFLFSTYTNTYEFFSLCILYGGGET